MFPAVKINAEIPVKLLHFLKKSVDVRLFKKPPY
jgi:hypothetical protein